MRTSKSTSISSATSSGLPISSSMRSRASAWERLRGNPSRMKPLRASGCARRLRIMASTSSSGTSWPASMAAFACTPRGVPLATSARSRSPVEICGMP